MYFIKYPQNLRLRLKMYLISLPPYTEAQAQPLNVILREKSHFFMRGVMEPKQTWAAEFMIFGHTSVDVKSPQWAMLGSKQCIDHSSSSGRLKFLVS